MKHLRLLILLPLLLLLTGSVTTSHLMVIARKNAAAPAGGVFVSDTFTGSNNTDLTAHTGETGATWAKVSGVTGVIKITSNQAKGDSGGASMYYASGTASGDEYDVEATFNFVTDIDECGVLGRFNLGTLTGYFLKYDHANNRFDLQKLVGGSPTSLGTWADSWTSGSRTVKLEIRDASKKVYVDSVERISSADNTITGAGVVVLYYNNSDWGFGTTGRPCDSFTATEP